MTHLIKKFSLSFFLLFILIINIHVDVISKKSNLDYEVLFTGENNLSDYLIEKIDLAKEKINIMVFIFEWQPIAEALIRANNRGVNVEVLTDIRSTNLIAKPLMKESVPRYLLNNGINVYVYDDRPYIMHHKVIFIDNILIIGSYNFQEAATLRNRENILLIQNEEIYNEYMNEYCRVKEMSFLSKKYQNLSNSQKLSLGSIWVRYRYIIALLFALSLVLNVYLLHLQLIYHKGGFKKNDRVLRKFFKRTKN
jgi:phospholipase D